MQEVEVVATPERLQSGVSDINHPGSPGSKRSKATAPLTSRGRSPVHHAKYCALGYGGEPTIWEWMRNRGGAQYAEPSQLTIRDSLWHIRGRQRPQLLRPRSAVCQGKLWASNLGDFGSSLTYTDSSIVPSKSTPGEVQGCWTDARDPRRDMPYLLKCDNNPRRPSKLGTPCRGKGAL